MGIKKSFDKRSFYLSQNNTEAELEVELNAYAKKEAAKLGLDPEKWIEPINEKFTKSQRLTTTLIVSGLTIVHDDLVSAALTGLGYHVSILPVANNDAFQVGKEFGNRGQCNPTYFTVGNLVKYLIELRDEQNISVEDIIENYVFLTANACGPCRFGMYLTEFRKALRDAGFEGFRVLQFQQTEGFSAEGGEEDGLDVTKDFVFGLARALIAGDIINILGYKIRPFEIEKGCTDQVIKQCRSLIVNALVNGTSVIKALKKCRNEFSKIKVDRSRVKPIVTIIGEFWAMTTEGDGNYHMHRFLENEGAQVEIQSIASWLLYMIWEIRSDIKRRLTLKGEDEAMLGLQGQNPAKKLFIVGIAEYALKILYYRFAKAAGLDETKLKDMDEIEDLAKPYYNSELRGGEGHMEVGKLIHFINDKTNHMTLSIKPFGCMPSASVSDGIQSLVISNYPNAIFLPIETTGDGEVNVYSRVQMMLYKARKKSEAEFEQALKKNKLTESEFRVRLKNHKKWNHSLNQPPHQDAGLAANLVYVVKN